MPGNLQTKCLCSSCGIFNRFSSTHYWLILTIRNVPIQSDVADKTSSAFGHIAHSFMDASIRTAIDILHCRFPSPSQQCDHQLRVESIHYLQEQCECHTQTSSQSMNFLQCIYAMSIVTARTRLVSVTQDQIQDSEQNQICGLLFNLPISISDSSSP